MNLEQLRKIVANGEGEQVEFKASTGQRTIGAKTVCAMLNGAGGHVLFGANDSGEIVGQDVTHRTITQLAQELRRIEPSVFPDIATVELGTGRASSLYTPQRRRMCTPTTAERTCDMAQPPR